MNGETLEDTGGHYYDGDSSGAIDVMRRNAAAALGEIKSGDAGKAAIGAALGFGTVFAVKGMTGASE
jgi:hypothetical protein